MRLSLSVMLTGYAVGSLALVADSFHMLNDVMSLIVALYALRVCTRTPLRTAIVHETDSLPTPLDQLSQKSDNKDPRYSYGWQRAEVLGALINGVFLLALCFSIFMEALERFINISEVSNPKVVIIVGSMGLASNIVGLFLFHDHGHAHGGHSHGGHSHGTPAAHNHQHSVPQAKLAGAGSNGSSDGTLHEEDEEEQDSLASGSSSAQAKKKDSKAIAIGRGRAGDVAATSSEATHRRRQESVGSLYGHPAQTRAFVVQAAHDMGFEAARSPPLRALTPRSTSPAANASACPSLPLALPTTDTRTRMLTSKLLALVPERRRAGCSSGCAAARGTRARRTRTRTRTPTATRATATRTTTRTRTTTAPAGTATRTRAARTRTATATATATGARTAT